MGAQWNIEPDPEPAAVEEVRARVRRELAALGVDRVADAELMAWELITNALRHARGPVAVLVARHGGQVRVEVVDGSPEHATRQGFDPERVGGHGVELVDVLSNDWGEASLGGGKAIWFDVACADETGSDATVEDLVRGCEPGEREALPTQRAHGDPNRPAT